MVSVGEALVHSTSPLAARQARVAGIRAKAKALFDGGATGVQVAASICDGVNEFVIELFHSALQALPERDRALIASHAALIAVGGSGRGEMAPYSDTDLLFLYRGPAKRAFHACAGQVVRDCWDAGLQLGHGLRTCGETLALARQETEVATALIEARLLAGDSHLFDRLMRDFRRKVIKGRVRAFVDSCLAAREEERQQQGSSATRLEPDVKRALGGLRDVHLIRWVGFATQHTGDVESLRLKGALGKEDARRLLAAQEFLMQIRNDLHFAAGRSQDVLNREEQLRIADRRGYEPRRGQLPVEAFMQTYFRHATGIAEIAERFVARQRPRSLASRLMQALATHRADFVFKIGPRTIDVVPRHRKEVCRDIERVLRLYRAAALYGVLPAPELAESLQAHAPELSESLSPTSARLFLDILGCSGHLGATLRSMYKTRVLERVLPPIAHARGLLQFNQYHSHTVDEHTLRAVEAAEQLDADTGPLGAAYRSIPRKQMLHFALLLHDLGKGFDEDHSDVGLRIAEQMSARFYLDAQDRDLLTFLVHKHLLMAHLAFRRDIADPDVLLPFSREVGTPETLRMLYVLTAADIQAVGPGVWTDWKAELLSEFYNRAMIVVSGQPYRFHEEERLKQIKAHVRSSIVPLGPDDDRERLFAWIDRELDALPAHYWSSTPAPRIAQDLQNLQQLPAGGLLTQGAYDRETGTVEYRIIAHRDLARGCFHKLTGALTAKRMEILSAQIITTAAGDVIDSFRVCDRDYDGRVPSDRIDEVNRALRSVVDGQTNVQALFQQHRRFRSKHRSPVSNLPTRVAIDNGSSDRCTVIDVFAHDRPGLLYTIAQFIYEVGLSVELAKISTHLDQVVDVFYVTSAAGNKLDHKELPPLKTALTERLEEFEQAGRLQFAS